MSGLIQNSKQRKSRWMLLGLVLVVLMLASLYYVISPFLFLGSLQTAIRDGDATALENLVDFPSVRQSLKAQMAVAFTHFMNSDSGIKDNPFSGLGLLLGPAMIDRIVESYCTPEIIASMSKTGATNNKTVADDPMQISPPDFSHVDWSKLHFQLLSADSFRWGTDQASLIARWQGFGRKIVKLEISQTYLENQVKPSQ